MAHKWVVRTDAYTPSGDRTAHLVQARGVIRGQVALCGFTLKALEFWQKAPKQAVVCVTCKSYLHRK